MRKLYPYFYMIVLILIFACGSNDLPRDSAKNSLDEVPAEETLPFKENSEPKFKDSITMEKVLSIPTYTHDYNISYLKFIDADNQGNIYVGDGHQANIVKFNKDGKFIKIMGRRGQGPRELESALSMAVDNNLYILAHNGIKVWDYDGNYIDKYFLISMFSRRIFVTDKSIYIVPMKFVQQNINALSYSLYRWNKDFEEGKDIIKFYSKDSETQYYRTRHNILVNRHDEIYLTESHKEYKINKCDMEGNKVLSFGRPYTTVPFSPEGKKGIKDIFGSEPKFEARVRQLFVDSKDNIFVVVGETSWDADIETDTIIDVFSRDGDWLDSVTINDVAMQTNLKNDRLYTVTPINTPGQEQFISVYQIQYNDNVLGQKE